MAPNWQVTLGRRGLLVPGRLYIGYTEQGGPLMLYGNDVPKRYRVVDPRSGEVLREGGNAIEAMVAAAATIAWWGIWHT
mgnify:CR=1 FL=1